MADDVLSADERDTLLKPSTVVPGGCSVPRSATMPRKPSSDWCFSPPLSEESRSAMIRVGQEWARRCTAELPGVLRRVVRIEPSAVTQVTYRELAARMSNPTCFNLLSAPPLEGHWMLEIGPEILYPAIDCMLGGGRAAAPIAARPLTDIELRLAGRVTSVLVRELQATWRPTATLDLAIERVSRNPNVSPVVKSNEPIIWSRFEMELLGTCGAINLGIPTASVAGVFEQPHAASSENGACIAPTTFESDGDQSTIELIACLAQSKIAPDEVRDLSVGDVITTDQRVDDPIVVVADGIVRYRAHSGALDGRKAVEIEEVASPPEEHGSPE